MENNELKQKLKQLFTQYRPPTKDVRWIFDYESLYWEIKAKLMGGWVTKNKDDEIVIIIPDGVRPMLNITGIEETMAIVNGFISKIQGLSILDEERVFVMCKDLWIKLSKMYYINMENFDIDPARASIVLRVIMNLFETNLRKSLGGRSMRMIGETEKIVQSIEEPERKKILGVI